MRARARARAYVRGGGFGRFAREGSDALRAYGYGRRVRRAFVIFSQKSVKNFHKKIFEKVLKND